MFKGPKKAKITVETYDPTREATSQYNKDKITYAKKGLTKMENGSAKSFLAYRDKVLLLENGPVIWKEFMKKVVESDPSYLNKMLVEDRPQQEPTNTRKSSRIPQKSGAAAASKPTQQEVVQRLSNPKGSQIPKQLKKTKK